MDGEFEPLPLEMGLGDRLALKPRVCLPYGLLLCSLWLFEAALLAALWSEAFSPRALPPGGSWLRDWLLSPGRSGRVAWRLCACNPYALAVVGFGFTTPGLMPCGCKAAWPCCPWAVMPCGW